MNAVEYIRTKIFDVKQAPFAEVAGVSQATVSRWESKIGSEPSRDEMERIRSAAIARRLPWDDSWFFQTFPDDEQQESAA